MLRRLPSSAGRDVRRQISSPCLRSSIAAHSMPGTSRTLVSSVLLSNDGYEQRQVTELKAMLRQRGLPQSGRKLQLIERLKENDLARAGTGAPASTSAAPPRRKSSSRRAAPRGQDAAAAAEARAPTANLEPGSVSAIKDAEGNISSRSPATVQVAAPSAPGKPIEKAEPTPQFFNVRIPEPKPEPEVPQYIPIINPVVQPSTDSPFIAHVPQVHSVVSPETVSHASLLSTQTESAATATPKITSSVASTIANEIVPPALRRQARESLSSIQNAKAKVSEVIEDSKNLLATHNTVAAPDTSNARPSGRRPLNGDERRGLLVLGGIIFGGFTAGGLFRPRAREESASASASALAPSAPVRNVPHYSHGGGVVGAGTRKC
ncbi:hypothetical protein MCUN1_002247 [Malassezia cuniculi]|uniref:SAP domain-containing protein n=1 Tax=Malassezia cuniculi TaxID=948313 RepID=A0AAF0EZD5_9BASI|nr:hypothetical protein MCUN1_002247 [Malassezia cuniculi]